MVAFGGRKMKLVLTEQEREGWIASLSTLYQDASKEACYVCGSTNALQEHHVYPQAYGGRDLPTVMLCASHHNNVHAVVDQCLSRARRNQEMSFKWPFGGDKARGARLVNTAIYAFFNRLENQRKVQVRYDDNFAAKLLQVQFTLETQHKKRIPLETVFKLAVESLADSLGL